MKATVTIKDVAKLAEVSVSTVSLVINNATTVKHETKYRVLDAIKTLQYKPNLYARSLVTKQKKIIGVIKVSNIERNYSYAFDTVCETFLHEVLKGIDAEVIKTDFSLLSQVYLFQPDSKALPELIDMNKVDGIIIIGGIFDDKTIERIVETQISIVLAGARQQSVDYVDTDPAEGIYSAMKYLVAKGHREIAFINGPEISKSSSRKMKGYLKALKDLNLHFRDEMISSGDFTGQAGYDAMEKIWTRGCRPTAVLAAADNMVIGALRYLHEKGLHCPEDISAVGYEDGLLAEYSIPPLTTIRVHKEILGAEALRILINRINNPKSKLVKLVIAPELVERGSVRQI